MKEYKELGGVDLKLHLLSGSGIKVENLEIEPYILREIKDYGYKYFMKNLQWISISVDDFISSVLDLEKRITLEQEKSKLKTFDFFMKLGGLEMRENALTALSMIFKTDDVKVLDEGVVAVDFEKKGIVYFDDEGELRINENKLESLEEDEITIVHRENFDEIVEVIKLQNYLTKPVEKKSDEKNPADEETRKLMEFMENQRKIVEEKKRRQKQQEKGDDDEIDITDIISAVSSKSHSINKLNIWELTLYQLYDEYARLELIDNYDFSIRAMMAGAEKIDLKHWSSKL